MTLDSDQVFFADFSFKEFDELLFIGKGACSTVIRGRLCNTDKLYACEVASKPDPSRFVENLNREIALHKALTHKNIVKLYGYFIEDNHVNIILDYIPNGNLFSFIRTAKDTPIYKVEASKKTLDIYLQICETVEFLHRRNILHRDIKPENILLDENFDPVFCDFGWSVQLDFNESRETFCGTLEYIAPEIFRGEMYSKPADVWSLGVLLYEMLHGYSPFKGKTYKEVSEKVLGGGLKFDGRLSSRLCQLIRQILSAKPEKRPTLENIIHEVEEIIVNKEASLIDSAREGSFGLKVDTKGNKTSKFGDSLSNIKAQSPIKLENGFIKAAFSNLLASKLGSNKKTSSKLHIDPTISTRNLIEASNFTRKNLERAELGNSSEIKKPLTILKVNSNSNLIKGRITNPEVISMSNSEKKIGESGSNRRKKVRGLMLPRDTDELPNDTDISLQNKPSNPSKPTLGRKKSNGIHLTSSETNLRKMQTTTGFQSKEQLVKTLLKKNAKKSSARENLSKIGQSKDKSSQLSQRQTKNSANLYTKVSAIKTSPKFEGRIKLSGKLSESQKGTSKTPKGKSSKDLVFLSLMNLHNNYNKPPSSERDKEITSQILGKLSRNIIKSKSGSEFKKVTEDVNYLVTQRLESRASNKEMFKAKAKSFRAQNTLFNKSAKLTIS